MVSRIHKQKVLIVGAGVGGITTAALLAQKGYEVTVLEKNDIPGGRCGHMVVDGYHFDTGATFFMMPELYERTFALLGERMADHLDLRPVDPTYTIHFNDDSILRLTSNLRDMETQLEAIERGSFGRMLRYLHEAERHYTLSLDNMVTKDFHNWLEFCSPKNLLLFLRLRALVGHIRYVNRFFKDPRLRIAFTFHDMYMGLSPYESPAIYSLLQYTELANGLWYRWEACTA